NFCVGNGFPDLKLSDGNLGSVLRGSADAIGKQPADQGANISAADCNGSTRGPKPGGPVTAEQPHGPANDHATSVNPQERKAGKGSIPVPPPGGGHDHLVPRHLHPHTPPTHPGGRDTPHIAPHHGGGHREVTPSTSAGAGRGGDPVHPQGEQKKST